MSVTSFGVVASTEHMMKIGALALAFASVVCGAAPVAQEWQIDPAHSAAQFFVRHMMVTTVRGQFGKLTGTVRYDQAAPSSASVQAEVDVSSVDTKQAKRDAHLKSADFFDVANHPTMTFKSAKVEPTGQGKLKVTGDLTIRGATRQVVFDVDGPTSPVKDRRGLRMGAAATAKINRKDFGITWNKALEAGGVTVSDEVTIMLDLELVQLSPD